MLSCLGAVVALVYLLVILNTVVVDQTYLTAVQQRLPNCIIIGARKCGTRALLEFLSLNPQIRTARYEVHFFDANQTYLKGLDWYRSHMPESLEDQITVEKTPSYFITPWVPERVYQMNPMTKLLLIVRDPVDRTISDYTQVHFTKLSKGKPHKLLESAAFKETNLSSAKEFDVGYKPIRNSLYGRHIGRWLKYFPLDQIHIVDGDQFRLDPLSELSRVEDFLGLKHKIQSDQIYFNDTKGFFCYTYGAGEHRCLGDTKGRPHVTVQSDFVQQLRRFYRPHNQEFFKLVKRKFHW